MGNKQPKCEDNCIEEINKIDVDNLDLSNIDKLQIKAIKEISNKLKEIEEKKSNRIMYKLGYGAVSDPQ